MTKEQAQTLIDQLGGRQFIMMTGAKNFIFYLNVDTTGFQPVNFNSTIFLDIPIKNKYYYFNT